MISVPLKPFALALKALKDFAKRNQMTMADRSPAPNLNDTFTLAGWNEILK